jgi:hypothetical protein
VTTAGLGVGHMGRLVGYVSALNRSEQLGAGTGIDGRTPSQAFRRTRLRSMRLYFSSERITACSMAVESERRWELGVWIG